MHKYLFCLLSPSLLFASIIPFKFEPNSYGGGRIYIQCRYMNYDSSCFLDLGADSSIANNEYTENLKVVGQTTFTGAAGQVKTCDIVNVETWSTSSYNVKNIKATRCQDSIPSDMIGINFFKKEKILLDFAKQHIEVSPKLSSSTKLYPLKIYPSGHIAIKAKLGDTEFLAMYDTGSSISAVDQNIVDSYPNSFEFIKEIEGRDSTGSTFILKLYKMKNFSVNGMTFPTMLIVAFHFSQIGDDFPTELKMFLGTNIMNGHRWFFDLKNKEWALQP